MCEEHEAVVTSTRSRDLQSPIIPGSEWTFAAGPDVFEG